MSSKPGRNSPCPCGSGKKYKKCCLSADKKYIDPKAEVDDRVLMDAVGWLLERFGSQVFESIRTQYCASLTDEQFEELHQLPEDVQETYWLNASEWALAEGEFPGGKARSGPFIDQLFRLGPIQEVGRRRYLEAFCKARLDLYEVVEAKPGEGLWLISKTQPEAKKFWVRERLGSESLEAGDIIGARVVGTEPLVLSGAIYPFKRHSYLNIRELLEKTGTRKGAQIDPDAVTRAIIQTWLEILVGPPPKIVDSSTGEPILLSTIHYRIRDWAKLERTLESDPTLLQQSEDSWVRLEEPDGELTRSLYAINRTREDRIELFARTEKLAAAGQAWFEEAAGDSVKRLAREVSDPTHLWKARHEKSPRRGTQSDPLAKFSPEEKGDLYRRLHEKIYDNWVDDPIPALKGKTPRQAIRSAAGRRDVVELLRTYEIEERKAARQDGRTATDFQFLWDQLGLSREEFLS